MATTNDADPGNAQAGAFSSIMPVFDDLLNLIGKQATSNEVGGGSNEEIVKKAKQLRSRMDEMKKAALGLPGGQVSLDQAVELEAMLDAETEKRRALLRAFTEAEMDTVDKMELAGETELSEAAVKSTESA